MPELSTRAPDSEESMATLANVVLVVALLAIAYTVWRTYADDQRDST